MKMRVDRRRRIESKIKQDDDYDEEEEKEKEKEKEEKKKRENLRGYSSSFISLKSIIDSSHIITSVNVSRIE